MHKITPHLWFNTQAKEAAEFYTTVFPDTVITNITTLSNTPSGDAHLVSFSIAGQPFMAISAGPLFKPTPAISFFVNIDPSKVANAEQEVDRLWGKLIEGGKPLMEIGAYPFSKRYGWVEDKYGVSWQIILTNPEGDARPYIVPSLMYVGAVAGRAEEAIDFYCSVFTDSVRGITARYPAGMAPDKEGSLMYADFRINDTWFAAMDSAHDHKFSFTEGVSLIITCDTQEEINHFSDKLSADPAAEQCGWVKDRFGVSWQISPAVMGEMMQHGTPEQVARVTQAFLPMKRFDIKTLEAAYGA